MRYRSMPMLLIPLGVLVSGVSSCRPSDILSVPTPSGQVPYSALEGRTAAEEALVGTRSQFFAAVSGSNSFSGINFFAGLLSDEFTWEGNGFGGGSIDDGTIDARLTSAANFGNQELGDGALEALLQAREGLLVTLPNLQAFEPASGSSKVAEAWALVGYTELFMAEDFCAGVVLSNVLPNGGWQYGVPLTTDSLFGVAEAHFDSAVAHAAADDTIAVLARVGLGRTLLDRGRLDSAAAAVSAVTPGFIYNSQAEPTFKDETTLSQFNWYAYNLQGGQGGVTVANQEGGKGLDFILAHDPRLALDDTFEESFDGAFYNLPDSVLYLPLKFYGPASTLAPQYASSGLVPLATGIEAQLITAEAELAAHDGAWLTTLNTLRNSGCHNTTDDSSCAYGTGHVPQQSSGLQPLADPGTDTGRINLLFRERAFWLFGTGTRLGDMRRLVRQYSPQYPTTFAADSVYPTGVYANGLFPVLPKYGEDVDLTLPTTTEEAEGGYTTSNPNYRGCITPTTQA